MGKVISKNLHKDFCIIDRHALRDMAKYLEDTMNGRRRSLKTIQKLRKRLEPYKAREIILKSWYGNKD